MKNLSFLYHAKRCICKYLIIIFLFIFYFLYLILKFILVPIYIYIVGIEAKEMENWFIHQNNRSLIERIINYLS